MDSWVEKNLQQWNEMHRTDGATCGKLYERIKRYHTHANALYAEVPTRMSIMYLTILELWVACDKAACSVAPLLPTYDPELRLVEFQCLTLPLRSQLKRL